MINQLASRSGGWRWQLNDLEPVAAEHLHRLHEPRKRDRFPDEGVRTARVTSREVRLEADLARSYAGGANSFIRKPVTFSGLVEAMQVLGRYWLEIVELPPPPS